MSTLLKLLLVQILRANSEKTGVFRARSRTHDLPLARSDTPPLNYVGLRLVLAKPFE